MKNFILVLLVFCGTFAFAGTPNSADYNLTVHVVSSRTKLVHLGDILNRIQVLSVLIDGKKYELQSTRANGNKGVLLPGDYKAKSTDDNETKYDVQRIYEFLLPDGKTRKFLVTGISE